AADATAAVSATGDGDVFIRVAFARRVADLVELEGVSLERACDQTLMELGDAGGQGGAIALTLRGAPVMRMNAQGMFRGLLAENGEIFVAVLKDEPYHAPAT
ncbi:MAG: isoaspartyl peptidase/L-asparaginase, partial [Myxococcota bacterium]